MRTPSVSRRTLLAGASVGALAGVGGATLKLGPDTISTRVDSPGWPLVHHDTRNTGFNRHADGPASDPDVRWRADRFDPEGPFRGYAFLPPAVASGRSPAGRWPRRRWSGTTTSSTRPARTSRR